MTTIADCQATSCKNAVEQDKCKASCVFVDNIYRVKPGVCPKLNLKDAALGELKNLAISKN